MSRIPKTGPLSATILIYTADITPRLQYIVKWLFDHRLGIECHLTTDAGSWLNADGPKINYSQSPLGNDELRITPHSLLMEKSIRPQELAVQRWKHSTILFYNQPGAPIPFDLFAAAFYLISRYEEYLPFTPDKHGRYPHTLSAAAHFSFLQQPVVDEWLFHFGKILQNKWGIALSEKAFRFQPTYDVDIAWKYLHKGATRHWGGYLKDILKLNAASAIERRAVVAGKRKDPYDCFAWLDELHTRYQLQPLYFFLVSAGSQYDRNTAPGHPAMQQLIHRLGQSYTTGLHPSYRSHEDKDILEAEKDIVSLNTQKPVTRSRQHYIKFTLPHTYRTLIQAGITDDYSMGYASANGFRAGTSHAFPWYDLEAEMRTCFQVHPFVYMDATSRFYERQNPAAAWQEWERLWHAVKKVNGVFTGIWHNHLLGPAPENKGWPELYAKMLGYEG